MTNEQIINFLKLIEINKSQFARRFYGIDSKYDSRIQIFSEKINGRYGQKFTADEFKKLKNVIGDFLFDVFGIEVP